MRSTVRSTLAVALLLAAACSDDPCDAAALREALEGASPGETVSLGACRVTGAFTVPAGVVLAGSGEESVIVGSGDGPAVTLVPGAQPAILRRARIESRSGIGVRAAGEGAVEIHDVTVHVTTGIGVGVRDVDVLAMSGVTIDGPVTPETADDVAPRADTDTGSFGLVLVDVASDAAAAVLSDVLVQDLGPWGAILIRSFVEWTGGGASRVVGTSVLVSDGRALLRSVEVSDVFQGVQPLPPYGLAVTGTATVETDALSISGSEGIGLLQAGTEGVHTALSASGNRFGAVWVQDSARFELAGASVLADNRLAGVVLVRSRNASIEGARIERTEPQVSIYGEAVGVEAADGVQVLDPTGPVALSDVTLSDNGRVGLLVSLGTAPIDRLSLANVAVTGAGAALGAVAQNDAGLIPSGTWDTGVVRDTTTAANDPMVAAPLGVLGGLPATNLPASAVDP